MAEKETDQYLELWKQLDDQFTNWLSYYKEITDYVLPRRGKYLDAGQTAEGGEKRHSKIYDGTATRALRMMAAGIQGGLTSPARPWFRFIPPSTGMLKGAAVREWLQAVENMIYTIYARTNFYQCIHTVYEEQGSFGTGVVLQEEDTRRVCRFKVLTAGEYRLATNHQDTVDTLARVFWMTARQMEQKFGKDRLSRAVKDCLKKGNNKQQYFKVLHIVRPNADRDESRLDSANMPFESVYLEYEGDGKDILERKGYNENPFACPRWSTISNEPYGVSPAMDLLGDIKMLQVMTKDVAQALHKTLDPPMRVPTTYKDMLNRLPGGVNWIDPTSDDAIKPLYQINFDVQSTQSKIADTRQQIREGFYNDLFMMISQAPGIQPKNQMEIMEMQEEKLIMLGPVIERQFHELLDPIVSRTFNIAWRKGLIPPPPPELMGADIKVEYISFLAQAQKRIGTQAIASSINFIGGLASMNPDALDKLDVDAAIDSYSDLVGTPAQIIRDAEEVAAIREAKAQAQAQAQQMAEAEAMATTAKGIKQLSAADTEGNNALTAMIRGAQQQAGAGA